MTPTIYNAFIAVGALLVSIGALLTWGLGPSCIALGSIVLLSTFALYRKS